MYNDENEEVLFFFQIQDFVDKPSKQTPFQRDSTV